jgi:hypothetical protein
MSSVNSAAGILVTRRRNLRNKVINKDKLPPPLPVKPAMIRAT